MGGKRDRLYYLIEFGALKKRNRESILDFTKRFSNIYNKIPTTIKPSHPIIEVTYANAFESDFSLLLREIWSRTLVGMQDDAIDIEANMNA